MDDGPGKGSDFCCEVSGVFHLQAGQRSRTQSHDIVNLLEMQAPAFISAGQWPSNSPDLNPVDYDIWGVIRQRVYRSRVRSVDELKQRMLHIWQGIEQIQWNLRMAHAVQGMTF